MHLPISPDAPAVVRAAATAVLYLHIGGASAGLVSGSVAMLARKGRRLHRAAGNVFFVSMLVMSGIGVFVAPLLPDRISSVAGAMTFYLVATGWAAARRPAGRVGRLEVLAMLGGLAVAAAGLTFGLIGAARPHGLLDGGPYQVAMVFAGITGLGAACDLKVILAGGVSGKARITRHAWRMGVAFAFAMFSFAAQPKAVPEALRGSPLLFLPVLAAVVLVVFWIVRTRFTGAFARAPHSLQTQGAP